MMGEGGKVLGELRDCVMSISSLSILQNMIALDGLRSF